MYASTGQIDLRQVIAATSALRQGKVASASPPSTGLSTMAKVAIGGGLAVAAFLIVRRMRKGSR